VSTEPRVAVVTGGSSGIGLSLCEAFAARGYHLLLVGSRSATVAEAARRVERAAQGGTCIGRALDVASESDMQAMADEARERFGRIDVLVASAGIGKKPGSARVVPYPSAELPLDEWQAVVDVNLTGMFLSNRAVLPVMIAQGDGAIVNVCSSTTPHGLRGTPFAPAYCATKFGMVGFTEALAEEVAPYGIRVQAVHPGPVETPLVADTTLMRRFGGTISARHFAETVVWMVEQPSDSLLVHPHVLPFVARRRSGGTGARQEAD